MTEKYAVRISRRTALTLALAVGVEGAIGTVPCARMVLSASAQEHGVLPIGMNISGISDWGFRLSLFEPPVGRTPMDHPKRFGPRSLGHAGDGIIGTR